MVRLLFFAACVCCLAFRLQDVKKNVEFKDGQIWVDDKLYCLYEEPKKGSRSFNISTTDGEVVIVANVKVEEKQGKVNNYFHLKFLPSGNELNIKYSKNFPKSFRESLVMYDVLKGGIWNEYEAMQLYSRWSLDKDAIVNPQAHEFVYNAELSDKLADLRISINEKKQIFINDSLVYQYVSRNNWMRSAQYKTGIDGTYYSIYDLDSNLQTQVSIYDHRSEMNNNVQMIIMPEQKLYYFNHIDCKNEKAVVNTAVKMLIIKKWSKS